MPLNQILYGPPGTGKTYRTRRLAVAIIDGEDKVKGYKDEKLKKRYEELRTEGRIVFTTFHQSLGYEEFVEGIKPKIQDASGSSDADEHPTQEDKDQIQYEIQDGIFKTIAERALRDTLSIPHKDLLNQKPTVWKIALGTKEQVKFKEECLKNNYIKVGWDKGDLDQEGAYEKYRAADLLNPQLMAFHSRMSIGDLLIVYQNRSPNRAGVAAVGIIVGNYVYDEKYKGEIKPDAKHTRPVKWLWKQQRETDFIDVYNINNAHRLARHTVYKTRIRASDLLQKIQEKSARDTPKTLNEDPPKYVLIIDEINRGNISKILGELITLIEDNKRLGNEEAMKVKLPYSGDDFGVPNNLYIIGTMNTADRSIAFLDTALRRRFSFIEMMPDYDVLAKELKPIAGINIPQMLKAMNEQIIEQHDRDHQIGHSYFLRLKKSPELNVLAEIFKHEIIPLLREYFYNDAAQIEKVLNGKEFLNEGDDLDKALQKVTHYQNIYKSSPNP